jgi:FAS-associated factor 2
LFILFANLPPLFREVLCSDLVVEFLNTNFITWGSNVYSVQGFKFSTLVGAYNYPFFAVCCHYPPTMAIPPQFKATVLGGGVAVVDRIDGVISSEDLIARLTGIMETFNPVLIAARADQYAFLFTSNFIYYYLFCLRS